MQCSAIMTAKPVTLRDTESVAQAAQKLIAARELAIPVVDKNNTYIGMFGAEELATLLVPRVALAGHLAPNLRFIGEDPKPLAKRFRELGTRPVRDVADTRAIAVFPDTPEIEAFRIFCRNRAPLPVIDPANRRLLGTVFYWDLIKVITAAQ